VYNVTGVRVHVQTNATEKIGSFARALLHYALDDKQYTASVDDLRFDVHAMPGRGMCVLHTLYRYTDIGWMTLAVPHRLARIVYVQMMFTDDYMLVSEIAVDGGEFSNSLHAQRSTSRTGTNVRQ
jgi:hypothetical protein